MSHGIRRSDVRCPRCGAYLVDGVCPNHETDPEMGVIGRPVEVPEPVLIDAPLVQSPRPMVGSVVTFPWPTTNRPTFGITTTEPDEDGTIGVMVLSPHVHVNLEDVEEI